MLVAEYDYDTDIAVQREESLRIGIQQGFSDGSYQTKLETARLMKQANCELDFIMQMTGLSAEDIANLSEWAVINMLLAEYNYETDIAVQRAEEHEIAFAEGIEQGIEQGFS